MSNVKTFKVVLVLYLLALGLVAFLSGCKKDETESAAMKVNLTDAPGDFLSVNVEVQSVMLHYIDKGWVTLKTNTGIYDLLTLRNDVKAVLANTNDLPTGRVNQIRLVLGMQNSVVFTDSSTFMLWVPSGDESGLKINVDLELKANSTSEITLDFDAAQSVKERWGAYYKLSPVIKLK